MSLITQQITTAIEELFSQSNFENGDILVAGCSTSEVLGEKIGTSGSIDTANEIFSTLNTLCKSKGLYHDLATHDRIQTVKGFVT